MFDRTVMRFGAAAAMVGAVGAVIFNLLHPRPDDVESISQVVSLAAEDDIWVADHYALGWVVAIALLAFIVFSRSLTGEPSTSWGRVALGFGVVGVVLMMVAVVLEGVALREAAREASAATAQAVAYVTEGVFVAGIGVFFGLTPLLYGAAVVTGETYPRWLGWMSVISGTVGIACASIIFFEGISEFTVNGLFLVSSLLFTLWIGLMGWRLWALMSEPTTERATSRPVTG